MTEEFRISEKLPLESVAKIGTMLRTTRTFKRNGGSKRSMYKTDWDVPRMKGDDTMLGRKK